MRLDNYSRAIFQDKDIIELIYKNMSSCLEEITIDHSTETASLKENGELDIQFYKELDISQLDFDRALQSDWFMPDEYKNMDIEQWVIDQSPPWDPEATRVKEELDEFRARNMLDVLKVLKYIVDTLRQNNIVWGVGRGSSVASYVLYLIGIHRIDSLKYNLDWREFLR
jgi:DNA polymerase III alpha subunit